MSLPETRGSSFSSVRTRSLIVVIIAGLVASLFAAVLLGDAAQYLFQVMLVAWGAWTIGRGRISIRALIGGVPAGYNWWPILIMAVAGIVYAVGASTVVLYPVARYLPEVYDELFTATTGESLLHFFILAVIVAPLVEETIFRGILFSRLTAKWGMVRAMVVSSLAFGLLHFDPIGAFVFGIVACVLYVRTQSLIVPMVLHALNNFFVWLLVALEADQGAVAAVPTTDDLAFQGLIAMMIASPVVFGLLGRWWPSRGTPLPYDANQKQEPLGPEAAT